MLGKLEMGAVAGDVVADGSGRDMGFETAGVGRRAEGGAGDGEEEGGFC